LYCKFNKLLKSMLVFASLNEFLYHPCRIIAYMQRLEVETVFMKLNLHYLAFKTIILELSIKK
jgi:hypothetical protein